MNPRQQLNAYFRLWEAEKNGDFLDSVPAYGNLASANTKLTAEEKERVAGTGLTVEDLLRVKQVVEGIGSAEKAAVAVRVLSEVR